ncbi:serine hydrolase [Rhodohalobacter sp. 8-1]|uniref:serine hydrolase n=1 Tax=Rhodohalobacter sp. 8-1 TaxID=3131972 RepID=UPI0030EF0DDD
MENKTLSKNLVYQRKLKGLTQEELANQTSVTVRTIQRIEKGEVNPHLQTVKLLAAALNIEVDDLLQLENPKEEDIQKKWLLLLHGSPLLGLGIPLFNILIPLFIWIHKREDNSMYERHGRAVVNFQITATLLFLISFIALVTIQGYGFFLFISVIPVVVIVILGNIISVLNTQKCYYPLAIPFLRSKKSTVSKAAALLFITCLIGLASEEPVLSQSGTQAEESFSEFDAFSAELDSLRKSNHIPGLSVAIVKDQELAWSHGFGNSHFDTGDGASFKAVTPDTPFWIASVTKTFIGLLFLQLEEQGIVDLSAPINDLPGWSDFCVWLAQSTIIFGQDLQCDMPITLRNVLNHSVNGEPGTEFMYNPIMYSRLSRYIEYLNGNPISMAEGRHNTVARLIQENILGPAGMDRTMSSMWQRDKALVFFDLAQGFEYDNGRYNRKRHIERHLAGGAGIVSTVNDLAKYDIALDTGSLASEPVMEKLFSPAITPEGNALPYAFGWYVQEHRGETLIWHGGWDEDAGFSALYLKIPDRNLTLILLANSEGIWWGNPLDKAEVEGSLFARAFLDHFVFKSE